MNNDFFFSEVKIVANHAMRYSDPLEVGVEHGIKYLKQKRFSDDSWKFTEDRFDKYAERYTVLAKQMVKEFLTVKELNL